MIAHHRLLWQPPKVIWKEGLGFITITFSFFNEVTLSYYYSPLPQWLFFTGLWNTMENARSPQLSPITGFDRNYLHACLLEVWREGMRQRQGERGRGRRFGSLLQICANVPRDGRLTRNDGLGRRYESICKDASAALHSALLSVTDRVREQQWANKINIP